MFAKFRFTSDPNKESSEKESWNTQGSGKIKIHWTYPTVGYLHPEGTEIALLLGKGEILQRQEEGHNPSE